MRATGQPSSWDVIVVGGGVIGLSIARRLAIASRKVLLLDRDACGRAASWAGAGLLSPADATRQDIPAQLNDLSLQAYASFCAEIHEASGVDPEYDPCGELKLIFDEQEAAKARAETAARAVRFPGFEDTCFTWLDATEVKAREPEVADDVRAGVWCPKASLVRNPRLLAGLKRACEAAGVDVREGAAVERVDVEHERVTGVSTRAGRFVAPVVVMAAGAWSGSLCPAQVGAMPVTPVRGQVVLLKGDCRALAHAVSRGSCYFIPRNDGHVLLGATVEPESGFNVRTTARGMVELTNAGLRMCPGLDGLEVVATWAGLRPGTPDGRPYLGPAPGIDGLIMATGHFRTGLTLAPVTAEYIFAVLDGAGFPLDMTMFSPCREPMAAEAANQVP